MDERLEKLREPLISGLVGLLLSAGFSYAALEIYVITHISVGHQGVISQMMNAGVIAAGFAGFFSAFFSSYFTQRRE